MELTPFVRLLKPAPTDVEDVATINTNYDRIDAISGTPKTMNGMKSRLDPLVGNPFYRSVSQPPGHPNMLCTTRYVKVNPLVWCTFRLEGDLTLNTDFYFNIPIVGDVGNLNTLDKLDPPTIANVSDVLDIGVASVKLSTGMVLLGNVLYDNQVKALRIKLNLWNTAAQDVRRQAWFLNTLTTISDKSLGSSAPWYSAPNAMKITGTYRLFFNE